MTAPEIAVWKQPLIVVDQEREAQAVAGLRLLVDGSEVGLDCPFDDVEIGGKSQSFLT